MDWRKTVFRLRGLPHTVETREDAARLLSARLDNVRPKDISVYSLATSLKHWEDYPSKVATIMFIVVPAFLQSDDRREKWHIPPKGHDRTDPDLTLDTDFMGMTPLSDTGHLEHSYDCIAVSGLASHPFGSWQPKGSDKQFMWIRDELTKLRGVRPILYGYDTKLSGSRSFQDINVLAQGLISQLQTYWKPGSMTPLTFLAHSLGGLIVKEALRILAEDPSNKEYKGLLDAVRGAIFFGVPNLGMEQRALLAIAKDNPNGILIRELSPKSNFISQLNKAFCSLGLDEHAMFYWAYETLESPTAVIGPDGKPCRDGCHAILVSPDSATYGAASTMFTFPINADHSDMVKFSRGSHYYDLVNARLSMILRSPPPFRGDVEPAIGRESAPMSQPSVPIEPLPEFSAPNSDISPKANTAPGGQKSIAADLDRFRRMTSLTDREEENIRNTTYDQILGSFREMQNEQELRRNLMYMHRLAPFLVPMKQFEEVTEALQLFLDHSLSIAYIWGPMKYILEETYKFPEAFNSVLTAYWWIGDQIPQLQGSQPVFATPTNSHLSDVLVMIYNDILSFHADIIQHLKQRQWIQLFTPWWKSFTTTVKEIERRTARNNRLIMNQVSYMDFEAIQESDLIAARAREREREADAESYRDRVRQWLSPYDFERDHEGHRAKRKVCHDPGRWLLNNPEFKTWASRTDCLNPLLWLSGKPGAGKTVLASIVIDELSRTSGATVAYFYCRHGDEQRSSFHSVARSIMAQILKQNPHLVPYFYSNANRNDNAVLTSVAVAIEMLSTSLRSCRRTYIVIDGLDECGRPAWKQIVEQICGIIDSLPASELGSIRCLFVSQEDGIALEDFHGLPAIKIGNRNLSDITEFASVWEQKIVAKFGVQNRKMNIRNIVSGRAKGMFIFAELFAKYLEDQLSTADLEKQLRPDNWPVKLDNLYDRILKRIREIRGPDAMRRIEEILGWIVCARRPLRWEEVQSAVCINLDARTFEEEQRLANSPKELFASLVECSADGTVELVHETARRYLVKEESINLHRAHLSLGVRCITYLSFPYFDIERSKDDILSDMLKGLHQLYDYASACWALHLLDGMTNFRAAEPREDDLAQLQDSLENLIDSHWSPTHKALPDIKRVQNAVIPFNRSTAFNQIVQAVAWAKKQSSLHGIGPCDDEALDIWKVTKGIRDVVKNIKSNEADFETIKRLYGPNRYKCPRVNCHYYHKGFQFSTKCDRHIKRHDRPYLCAVEGCPHGVFGYATGEELHKHLFHEHYINEFADTEEPSYPASPKKEARKSGNSGGKIKCPECDTTFTQKNSLTRHIKNHTDEKRFACDNCDKRFKRKGDCERHTLMHGGKKNICEGDLRDGTKWGCKRSFSRPDKLTDHFRSKRGLKCITQMMKEKKESHGQSYVLENIFADQTGANAEALKAAGNLLPPFREVLELCGLSETSVPVLSRQGSPRRG